MPVARSRNTDEGESIYNHYTETISINHDENKNFQTL